MPFTDDTIKTMEEKGSVEARTEHLIDEIVNHVRNSVSNFSDPAGLNNSLDELVAMKGTLATAVAGTSEQQKADAEKRTAAAKERASAEEDPGAGSGGGAGGVRAHTDPNDRSDSTSRRGR